MQVTTTSTIEWLFISFLYDPLHTFSCILLSQYLIQLLGDIAGPRDVEALKFFVLNEAEKAGDATIQDEL
jgi:hypothetical protein